MTQLLRYITHPNVSIDPEIAVTEWSPTMIKTLPLLDTVRSGRSSCSVVGQRGETFLGSPARMRR